MPQPRVTLTGDALGGVRPEHAQRQPSGCKARRAASGERDRGCEELVGAPREGQEPLLRAGNHRLAGWFPGLNLTVQCAKCRAWVGPPQFPGGTRVFLLETAKGVCWGQPRTCASCLHDIL